MARVPTPKHNGTGERFKRTSEGTGGFGPTEPPKMSGLEATLRVVGFAISALLAVVLAVYFFE